MKNFKIAHNQASNDKVINDRGAKAKNLALAVIWAVAPFLGATTASAQSQSQTAQNKYQMQQAEYQAQEAASKLVCTSGYKILRYVDARSKISFICYQPGSYPQCKVPADPLVPVCIYTPVPMARPYDPSEKITPETVVNEGVEILEKNFLIQVEDVEVFITVSQKEKFLGKYLQKYYATTGKPQVLAPQPNETAPKLLPQGGLQAYTTPDAAQAAKKSPDDRIIPLTLKGKMKFANMGSLVYVRDQFLMRRFNTSLSTDPVALERQKLVFLNELVSKLKVTGFMDDNYAPITGTQASALGCKQYGSTGLNIIDSSVINMADGEVATGRQPRNDVEKSAASIISYWYKISGLTPYAQPATPTSQLDESASSFIQSRLLTCDKQPGLSDLPNLAKVAPHFMQEFAAQAVRTTSRDMRAFHWMDPLRVVDSDKRATTPPSSDARVVGYVDSNWRKFFFEPNHGDNVGNGLYLSLTPPTTASFGDMAIDVFIPKGTRFVSFLNSNLKLSAEALTELSNLECQTNSNVNVTSFFTGYGGSAKCLDIARSLVRQLGITMAFYSYISSQSVSQCQDASTPNWSIVMYDPHILNPAHITVYNVEDQSDRSKWSDEQKMIAEFLTQTRYRNYGQSSAPQTQLVTPEQFSKWVNTQILGCGMGTNWMSSWQ